jgi:hypothetical protein
MANVLPQIEDTNRTVYFPPKGYYETFEDEAHYAKKVKEWGLSSAREVKKQFWYKEADYQRLVTIKGYESYGKNGEFNTIVIEFQDGHLTCIHPAYLKEMQSPSFEKMIVSGGEKETKQQPPVEVKPENNTRTVELKNAPVKKEKEIPTKLVLPEEKVHFTAVVKKFALTWNNFTEENDEVVILEKVVLHEEPSKEIGLAWCSHSKTLKKLELSPGQALEFDGKIIKKKLPKGKDVDDEFIVDDPVPYKINNPSKIKSSAGS